jgi:choline dehydrogenase
VIIDHNRAVGVRAIIDGRPRELSAGWVVVCAGAYGSAEVLLRSGIGPADELRALAIEVIHDLPGVGRNLHDQPAVHLEFAGTAQLAADLARYQADHWLPEEQVIAKLATPLADGPYNLHTYPWVEVDDKQPARWRCVIPTALLTPRSRGHVSLRAADPTVRGRLDHAFLSDPDGADLTALVQGLGMLRELVAKPSLEAYCGQPLVAPPDFDDRPSLEQWARFTHRHYWHPAGTCKMGHTTDLMAVVDAVGRVHGVANLTVADASVLPRVPRSTPALPVVVTAERIAASFRQP